MKNFKLSMLAMLSVIAMTFTSCLGDGDNTQYVTGTGSVSTSSSIVLDNGLTLKTNALNLSMGDRVYIYASVPGEEYEAAIAKLQEGKTASVNLENIYQAGACVDGEFDDPDNFDDHLATMTASEIESLSWLSFGSFGNGYMNFSIKGEWYTQTVDKTEKTIEPKISLLQKNFDASAKKLELVLVYNNRKAECVDTEGKLKDGYKLITGYEIPVSVDVNDLYSEMTYGGNLKDEDKIELSVKYVTGEDRELCGDSDKLTGTFYGTNYCTVSMFKRYYY